jgi:hypothetical protein
MRRVAALGLGSLALLAACAGGTEAPPRVSAPPVLPPRGDWSAELPRFLPAIRACLADAGGQALGVTKAWQIGQGLTGVRVLVQDEGRQDCVAVADGTRVLLTEKVHPNSRLPGERDPIYTPVAMNPPRGACFEVSAARDDGDEVGWLSYDVCRDPRPVRTSAGIREPARPAPPQEG